MIGLVLLAGPGSSWAQEPARTPSPEELWNAYPLEPGGTALTMEQESPPADAIPARSPAPNGSDDDGGFPAGVAIALVAVAFVAGLALGRGRRRETTTEAAMAVRSEAPAGTPSPAAPERRFEWRDYPQPSRPAPPPPPPPGPAATTVAVAPHPSPWPQRTVRSWRAEVVRRPGEGVEVVVLRPGAQSLPPGDPLDDDPELADALRDVHAAIEMEGWTPVGPHRFVWPHVEPPPGRGVRH